VNSREDMQARIATPADPNQFLDDVRDHLRAAKEKH
jgi:hypothetical protein